MGVKIGLIYYGKNIDKEYFEKQVLRKKYVK
jgi:hypothetical protein